MKKRFLKTTLLVLPLSVLLGIGNPAHATELESALYSRALSLYSMGSFEQSYSHFEQVFASAQEPADRRIRASLILAYAPNSALKLKKRQDYALYYLAHTSSVAEKTRSSLYRLIGDAYFDQQNFEKASEYYTLLTQEKDLLSQAYGEYRLGWISLNQQRADLAFLRWAHFLDQSGEALLKHDQDLYQSIVRDLGRSWAEGVETLFAQNQPKDLSSFIPKTPGMKTHQNEWIDGIVLGLKRYAREDLIEEFKNQLQRTPYAAQTLQALLKKGAVFKPFPCNIVHWIPFLPEKSLVNQPDLFMILNACAKTIVEKKTCEKPESMTFQRFFNELELKDQQLLPRVSLSVSCKNWSFACRDFLQLALEGAQNQNQRLADDTLQPLVNSCLNVFEAQPSSTEETSLQAHLKGQYLILLNTYAEKHLFLPEEVRSQDPLLTPIATLLKDTDFKTSFIGVLKSPLGRETFSPTQISDLVLSQLSESERSTHAEALLEIYRKETPSTAWMNLFKTIFQTQITAKNYSTALQLLTKFFPMSAEVAQKEDFSSLWEFYWLELQPSEHPEQSLLVDQWFNLLPFSQLKTERTLRTLGVALHFEKTALIWKNWEVLKGSLKTKPDWMQAFLYRSLEQLKSRALSSELLASSHEGKILIQVSEEDLAISGKEVRALLGNQAQILTDLQSLEKMKALSARIQSKKLKLNGTLPRILKSLLTELQSQRALVLSSEWSSDKYLQKAKETFIADSHASIEKLEELKKSTSVFAELADLTEQLDGFVQKIKEQAQEMTAEPQPTEGVNPS